MNRQLLPYAKTLTRACDRLYLKPVWLGDELFANAATTLHRLSTQPEAFGDLKPCHTDTDRRKAINNLLTAAKAYVTAARRHEAPPHQEELPL